MGVLLIERSELVVTRELLRRSAHFSDLSDSILLRLAGIAQSCDVSPNVVSLFLGG